MGAVKVNNSTVGRAVEVNCSTAEKQQGVGLAIGKVAKVKD